MTDLVWLRVLCLLMLLVGRQNLIFCGAHLLPHLAVAICIMLVLAPDGAEAFVPVTQPSYEVEQGRPAQT